MAFFPFAVNSWNGEGMLQRPIKPSEPSTKLDSLHFLLSVPVLGLFIVYTEFLAGACTQYYYFPLATILSGR